MPALALNGFKGYYSKNFYILYPLIDQHSNYIELDNRTVTQISWFYIG